MTQPIRREFVEVLREMENGEVHYDLTEGLTNLIAAVMDTRKGGSMSLDIAVSPTGKGTVTMVTKVKVKEPEHPRQSTTFFVDDRWNLHRDDPRQEKMDLRQAPEPEPEVRQAPEEGNSLRVVSGQEE